MWDYSTLQHRRLSKPSLQDISLGWRCRQSMSFVANHPEELRSPKHHAGQDAAWGQDSVLPLQLQDTRHCWHRGGKHLHYLFSLDKVVKEGYPDGKPCIEILSHKILPTIPRTRITTPRASLASQGGLG